MASVGVRPRSASHCGDAVNLDVVRRTVAVSADDFLVGRCGGTHALRASGRQESGAGAASTTSASTGGAHADARAQQRSQTHGARDCEPRPQECGPALARLLVVAGGTVSHAVAPQRRVDARVQLRAAVRTRLLHDAKRRRNVASATHTHFDTSATTMERLPST